MVAALRESLKVFKRDVLDLADTEYKLVFVDHAARAEVLFDMRRKRRDLFMWHQTVMRRTYNVLDAPLPPQRHLDMETQMFTTIPVADQLRFAYDMEDLVDFAALAARIERRTQQPAWYDRTLRVLSLQQLLAKCGIPPYTLTTRAVLAYAWIQFLACVLLAIFLKLSAPERATWVFTGLAPVVTALVLLATYDVQQRATDRAALRSYLRQVPGMLERRPKLPCFGALVTRTARKLGAMATE